MLPEREAAILEDQLRRREAEWVRRRFLLFTGAVSLLSGIATVWLAGHGWAGGAAAGDEFSDAVRAAGRQASIVTLLQSASMLALFLVVRRAREFFGPRRLNAIAIALAQALIVIQYAHATATVQVYNAISGETYGPGLVMHIVFLVVHLAACALFAFSMLQATLAYYPAVVLAILALWLFASDDPTVKTLVSVTSLMTGLPGLLITWIRRSRFFSRVEAEHTRDRLQMLSHELDLARRIHERAFPDELTEGPVHVCFDYEPMIAIGGDMLFVHRHPAGDVTVLLIDVSGHGVAAALTCNRLFGELQRCFAREPEAGLEIALGELNEHLHLTLSDAGVFATAFAARISGADRSIRHASAGHPPAFLQRAGGAIESLGATCLPLGVVDRSDFDPAPEIGSLDAGDRLVAYTDGASEAMLAGGAMLGIDGVRELVEAVADVPARSLSRRLMTLLDERRAGRAQDDVFFVSVVRAASGD